MSFITFNEIIQIILVSVILGFIFSGFIKVPWAKKKDELYAYQRPMFEWENIKFAILISAPAVIFHELGHKFMALFFGLPAQFNAFWGGLGLGVFLKIIHAPFIILAPAYVSFPAMGITNYQHLLIAFAGPFVNLVFWLGSRYYIKKNHKKLSKKKYFTLFVFEKLNMWLFIFNMLPFPPLDGYHIYSNLYRIIF